MLRPPTVGQGARRAWSDSRGRIWISEWNVGKLGMYDLSRRRWREWRLPGSNALVRFDSVASKFTRVDLPSSDAAVRQILGRPGEVWGAESRTDKLVVVLTR